MAEMIEVFGKYAKQAEKPAPPAEPVPFVCPFCRGPLQITLKLDRDVLHNGRVVDTDGGQAFVLYCESYCREWKTDSQSNDYAGNVPSRDRIRDVLTWYAQQGGK